MKPRPDDISDAVRTALQDFGNFKSAAARDPKRLVSWVFGHASVILKERGDSRSETEIEADIARELISIAGEIQE